MRDKKTIGDKIVDRVVDTELAGVTIVTGDRELIQTSYGRVHFHVPTNDGDGDDFMASWSPDEARRIAKSLLLAAKSAETIKR